MLRSTPSRTSKRTGVALDGERYMSVFRYRIFDKKMWFGGFGGWKHHRRRGLRTMVVTMVSRNPMNGSEIMDQIEAMSQGWWRPSPGSIYPLLEELREDGVLRKREDGRYELTEKGRQEGEFPFGPFVGRRARGIEEMLSEISGLASYLEELSKSDKSRIAPYKEKIKSIANKLSAISN